jgi:phage tail-like protein
MADETKSMARRDFLKAAGLAAGVALAAPTFAVEAQGTETTEPGAVKRAEAPLATGAEPTDPIVGFMFALKFNGIPYGYFADVSGLGSENAVIETKAVDASGNTIVRKSPAALKWLDIHLKRGITGVYDLWDWRQLVVSGKVGKARKSGSVVMYDSSYTLVAQWDFINGWPSRIEAPISAATASGAFAVEEIVIVHEGITRVPGPAA